MESLIKYAAVGLISFGVTFGLTPWVIRLAKRLGFLDRPDARRIHERVVPRAGGVAVVLGFHSGCLAIYLLPWGGFSANLALDWYRAILAPTVVLLLTGLLDDRRGIPALAKLLGQAVAGWLLYWGGVGFGAMLGWTLPAGLDALITVLWCVGFINAFNLIDGLDGLAAGLGALAALGLAGAFLLRGAPGDTLVMLALAASCLAFLRYNFHPARIFLGDTGSMFIGFTLAAVSLGTHTKSATITALGVPLLAAGVPILDTALAIWRRGLPRLSPAGAGARPGGNGIMRPDTEHLHHRLLRVLGSQRRVAWLLYGLNAALIGFGLLSVAFSSSSLGIYLLVFVMSSYVVVRHLANVELWNSGIMVARGLRRPPKKVIAVLLYPVLDLGVLLGAFLASLIMMEELAPSWEGIKIRLAGDAVSWVGLPFLALAITRTYQRVWSKARLLDFCRLAVALAGGITLAVLVHQVLKPSSGGTAEGLEHGLLFLSLALLACGGLRIAPRILLDLACSRSGRAAPGEKPQRVLLYGGGYGCLLYLRARGCSLDIAQPNSIEGIVDDDSNLRGRYLHGYRVRGGLHTVPKLIKSRCINQVIATTSLQPEVLEKLVPMLREAGVEFRQWSIELRPHPGLANGRCPRSERLAESARVLTAANPANLDPALREILQLVTVHCQPSALHLWRRSARQEDHWRLYSTGGEGSEISVRTMPVTGNGLSRAGALVAAASGAAAAAGEGKPAEALMSGWSPALPLGPTGCCWMIPLKRGHPDFGGMAVSCSRLESNPRCAEQCELVGVAESIGATLDRLNGSI